MAFLRRKRLLYIYLHLRRGPRSIGTSEVDDVIAGFRRAIPAKNPGLFAHFRPRTPGDICFPREKPRFFALENRVFAGGV